MTIRIGDHLVIKRDGKVLGPEDEAYHEFEVWTSPRSYRALRSKHPPKLGYVLNVEVVK